VLISNAYAQVAGTPPDAAGGLMQMLPIILMFVVLWFLMIRPQMKKAKEHNKLIESLAKGDEIVTQGGVAGRIVKVGENYLTVEVGNVKDQSVEILIQKHAVSNLLPKGALKGQ
jgi:preprotein translocase subunit YajC